MKSEVVVTVEGGLVQSVDVFEGDEPGVYDPVVIDWDLDGMEIHEVDAKLALYESEALSLPEGWFIRANILAEVERERSR